MRVTDKTGWSEVHAVVQEHNTDATSVLHPGADDHQALDPGVSIQTRRAMSQH
jgi:hypothetical protein